jgi:xanthosine utilization system XapX-like protein
VRSPAPPVMALVGLLGILVGEQLPPLIRHALSQTPVPVAGSEQVQPHIFGRLPSGQTSQEKSS